MSGCAPSVAGIPAFYTPVGVGTEVADGKEERVIKGKRYILEEALDCRLRFHPRLQGGRNRQRRLPQGFAKLQSGDGGSRQNHDR